MLTQYPLSRNAHPFHLREHNGVATTRTEGDFSVQVEALLKSTVGAGDTVQLLACLPRVQEARVQLPAAHKPGLVGARLE